jgi:hypothetical protein
LGRKVKFTYFKFKGAVISLGELRFGFWGFGLREKREKLKNF